MKGAFFIVLLLAVKIGVERTTVGKELELFGYNILRHLRSSPTTPVHVVDISELPASKTIIDGREYEATSREMLRKIIDVIAAQEPAAIGINVDFSPDRGFVTPYDPEFFQYCLDKGVPIFLGVERTHLLPPKAWLGLEQYEKLGASIVVPSEETKRMPLWIQTNPNFPAGRTMGGALANAFGESHCMVGNFLERAGLAEQASKKELGKGGAVWEFLVDYNPLKALIDNRTVIKNADSISVTDEIFRNKIVLIGDGKPNAGPDSYPVSGNSSPVRGVYIHACAAHTLAVAPLYELTWSGRVAIDLALLFGILLAIVLVQLWFAADSHRVATDRLQTIFTTSVVIAAFAIGVLFVSFTCIMWSDFVLALGVIALHPLIARRLDKISK